MVHGILLLVKRWCPEDKEWLSSLLTSQVDLLSNDLCRLKQNKKQIKLKISTSNYGRSQRKSKESTGQVFFAFPIGRSTPSAADPLWFTLSYISKQPPPPFPLPTPFHQLRQPDRAGIMIIILSYFILTTGDCLGLYPPVRSWDPLWSQPIKGKHSHCCILGSIPPFFLNHTYNISYFVYTQKVSCQKFKIFYTLELHAQFSNQ